MLFQKTKKSGSFWPQFGYFWVWDMVQNIFRVYSYRQTTFVFYVLLYLVSWTMHQQPMLHQHPNIEITPQNCINTQILHQHPNIASRSVHWINIPILHLQPNIASSPEHCIDNWKLHKHPNIDSRSYIDIAVLICKNSLILHVQLVRDIHTDRQTLSHIELL